MDKVTFKYKRTKEDILKFNVWQLYFRTWLVRIMTFAFPLMGIFFLVTGLQGGADPIIFLAVAYLILYPFVNYLLIVLRVNRLFRNPELIIEETEFTYSNAGLQVKNEQGDIYVLPWNEVQKVYNNKAYIYIYTDKRTMVMVRKDILKVEEVEFIITVIRENCGPVVFK